MTLALTKDLLLMSVEVVTLQQKDHLLFIIIDLDNQLGVETQISALVAIPEATQVAIHSSTVAHLQE